MSHEFVSEMYSKALTFKDSKRGWFTAAELGKKVRCAPRTARFYCQSMVQKGLIERKNTFPSLSYKTVRHSKKDK